MDGTGEGTGSGVQYPLQPICERWQRALDAARKDRNAKFDVYADEAMNFYDGPINWMWKSARMQARESRQTNATTGHTGWLQPGVNLPRFEMSVNRLFEAVAMFGPVLYHQNPTIAVTPRDQPEVTIDAYYATDPEAQQFLSMLPGIEQGMVQDQSVVQMVQILYEEYNRVVDHDQRQQGINDNHALILEAISNYIQQEGSKQDEARLAITEAIITGLGLLETQVEVPPGGGAKMPRSRFRSNKDLLVDPDAKYWRDVKWIALRTCAPVNVVEEEYGLKPGTLKGRYARKAALEGAKEHKRNGDKTKANVVHDIVEYWCIYSKNGMGQHLKLRENDKHVPDLEVFGDFCKIVVCKNVPYPLNLPPDVWVEPNRDDLLERTSWESPFWDDYASDGGWPITRLTFYSKPGCVWPISMVKPCIGELRFVNWCMSFIADKVSADQFYVGVLKEAGENIRQQLQSGDGPYTLIELERISGMKMDDIISFMQAPSFSSDIWTMVAQVNEQIDKRLGLTELWYGMTGRQMRSAAEAQYRQQNINIRPDDMASRVEDWLSLSATREIQALRYNCDYPDVAPIVGAVAAQVYAEQILTTDVSAITRDFKFRVEAGTARKPNKDTQIAQLTDIGQYVLPVIQQAMLVGVTRPFNAYMKAVGRAMDIDVTEFLLGPEEQQMLVAATMPPPMEPAEENDEGSGEDAAETAE